jgi:hypothetical protein
MPAGRVTIGEDRFNTGTRPTSICAAESWPLASYSRTMRRRASLDLVTVGRTAGSIDAGAEGGGGGEEVMGGGLLDNALSVSERIDGERETGNR